MVGVLERVVILIGVLERACRDFSRLVLDSKFQLRRKSLQLICGFKYCNLPIIHHDHHGKLQPSNIFDPGLNIHHPDFLNTKVSQQNIRSSAHLMKLEFKPLFMCTMSEKSRQRTCWINVKNSARTETAMPMSKIRLMKMAEILGAKY